MLLGYRDDVGTARIRLNLLRCVAPAALMLAIGSFCGATSSAQAKAAQQGAQKQAEVKSSDAGQSGAAKPAAEAKPAPSAPLQRFDIDDFAVQGADTLPQIEVEEAIYP